MSDANLTLEDLALQNGRLKKWLACVTAWLVITWIWPAAPSFQPPREMTLEKLTINKPGSTPSITLEADDKRAEVSTSNGSNKAKIVAGEGFASVGASNDTRVAFISANRSGSASFFVTEWRGEDPVRVGLGVMPGPNGPENSIAGMSLSSYDGKERRVFTSETPPAAYNTGPAADRNAETPAAAYRPQTAAARKAEQNEMLDEWEGNALEWSKRYRKIMDQQERILAPK